jgi:hypothetical protein
MNLLSRFGRLAAITAVAGALAVPALAQDGPPDAHMHISGGSVGFIAGVSWGHGRIEYHGHSYKVKIKGLNVGSIGASGYHASGEIYHLRDIHDIGGTYGTADAQATAGVGGGAITLHNDHGVIINMTMDTTGLQATLAPGGVDIELE